MNIVIRFVVIALAFLPSTAFGAIIINEVAWMGTTVSANDEWIELYNTDVAPVSVEGWTLSDSMDLSITLTGSIGAQSYAVLERTDDTSVPGTAFLIYTGALANGGATLTLRDSSNALHDQVAGGENWENIGGDNTTKETAQYTSGGWITNTATPGQANYESSAPEDESDENTEDQEETESANDTDTSQSATPRKPNDPLGLVVELPKTIYVNQRHAFAVTPTGLGDAVRGSLTYDWNFGDLHTATGSSATHRYTYPGEYVVSVMAHYRDFVATKRQNVTVLPITLSLTDTADHILVHNDSSYEVDLSGYTLGGPMSVTFPERTFVRARATIAVPKVGISPVSRVDIKLYDATDMMVTSIKSVSELTTTLTQTESVAVVSDVPVVNQVPLTTTNDFTFASESKAEPVPQVLAATTTVAKPAVAPIVLSQTATPSDSARSSNDRLVWLGLVGLLGAAFAGGVVVRR